MTDASRTVHVVDDDEAVRHSIGFLLRKSGYLVESHRTGMAFLLAVTPTTRGCVLLDLLMSDIDGLEIQDRMARAGIALPIVMLAGRRDATLALRAVEAGAIDILEKPFERSMLLTAIDAALEHAAKASRASPVATAIVEAPG